MTAFVLLHGGGHRGRHWDAVRADLARLGHRSVAPDLPVDDLAAGAAAWADHAVAAIDDPADRDDVIVVGHSIGGLAVPVVAERLAARAMVFVCAQVPMPGMAYADYLATLPVLATTVPRGLAGRDDLGRSVVSWEMARDFLYNGAPEELARAAFAMVRPQAPTAVTETCPLTSWPAATSTYVLGTQDRALSPDYSRHVCDRLGTTPVELPSGHSPFLSHPGQLADVLADVAGGS